MSGSAIGISKFTLTGAVIRCLKRMNRLVVPLFFGQLILSCTVSARAETANSCLFPQLFVDRNFIVFFDQHSADLTPRARRILDELAALEKGNPNPIIQMGAEADTSEILPSDHDIRGHRGEAVRDYLIKSGLSPEWLFVDASGARPAFIPTAPNSPEPQNRRVALWPRNLPEQYLFERGPFFTRTSCIDWIRQHCVGPNADAAPVACDTALDRLK